MAICEFNIYTDEAREWPTPASDVVPIAFELPALRCRINAWVNDEVLKTTADPLSESRHSVAEHPRRLSSRVI